MKLNFRFPGRLLSKRELSDIYSDTSFNSVDRPFFSWKECRLAIIVFIIALTILLANVITYAQPAPPKGLGKGDSVPPVLLHGVSDYGQGDLNLSSLRGKVLILDFWATWCAPCVAMIPRMDSLQREFSGKVQFLGVAYQKTAEVSAFFALLEKQHGRHYTVPEVCGDTVLSRLFPHNSYPHYVWIGTDGKVAAITEFGAVTRDNIKALLASGKLDAPSIVPQAMLAYDYHKPMIVDGNGGDGHNLLYHSFLTSYTPGLHPGLAIVADSIAGLKITLKNNSIHWLFEVAYSDSGRNFNRQNTRYLVRDTTQITNEKASGQAYDDWLADGHGFCYELQVPPRLRGAALSMMRQDLDRYFTQYKAAIIKQDRQCLVLSRRDSAVSLKTAGAKVDIHVDRFGWKVTNCTLDALCGQLDFYQVFRYPIIDETGLHGPVDLDIPITKLSKTGGPDLEAINSELARYGLQLRPEKRSRDILTILDR